MTASLSAHLSPELLAALNRGQLPREQRAAVEEHLLNCRRCEEALAGVDEDSFVRRLRGQKSLDTLAPQAVTPGGRRPDSQPALPPALNDHPRYRIERKLGEGGMGAVWLAEHRQMQRQVALKVIHPDVARLPAFVERFRREVQAAARLDHPNVVRALDAEEAGGAHFLVMEYVEGIHLGEYARRCGGKVSATLATRVVAQAAVGLQHAHDNGMVHRDIKPHNLLLDRKGRVKVADFGLARCVSELSSESPLTEERSTLGTPDYMSPEQAENPRRADIRSDIYSLGCTLYFLLTGRPPFPEGGHAQKIAAHLSRQPTPLRELVAELPAGLEGVVARAMAKKPAQRYQTPAEFVAALKPFGKKPEPPAPRRRRPLVAVALVLLGLLVFGGVYHIRTSKGELIIETLDDSVEVVIRKNGEQVEIIDTKSKQKLELKAGTYTAEVPGMAGLTVEPQAFTIRRGQEEVVRVRRVVAPVPPRSATPSPTPAAPSVPASATAVTGELTVNTFTDGPQMQARVAVDARGNFVVVWMSREEDGSGWGVVGRRFAATGKPLGAVFPLSVWTQGDQEYPQIAMRPDGGFLTAWHGRGKQGYGVYARLFDAGAKPQGEEVLIAPSSQNRGQVNGVAVDGQGEWLVNWAMLNLRSDGFVRRLDRAGQPKGQAILVTGEHHCTHLESRLACGPESRWAVAFFGGKDFAALRVQCYDRADKPTASFAVKETNLGNPIALAFDARKYLTLVWAGTGHGDPDGVFCNRCDANGKALDRNELLINPEKSGPQNDGHAAGRTNGDAVVVWTSPSASNGLDVHAQYLNAAGKHLGEPWIVNTTKVGLQQSPKVAVNEAGQCVVAWQDEIDKVSPKRIVARVYRLAAQP